MITMKESQFRAALATVFERVGVKEDCEKVSKQQCLEFVKLVAMPHKEEPEPEEKKPVGKQIVDKKKKRAEEKRREEELEQKIESKAFEYYFYELLDFEMHDVDGNVNEYVDRGKLEDLVMGRAREQGITFMK